MSARRLFEIARAFVCFLAFATLVLVVRHRYGAPASPVQGVAWAGGYVGLLLVAFATIAGTARTALAAAVVMAVVVGVPAWSLRNRFSDDAAYEALRRGESFETVEALEAYVRASGRHGADVESDLLPRAKLRAADAQAGEARITALEALLRDHPGGAVAADARGSLAAALHAEMLGRETVRSLQAFVDRWPDAADAPAARDKIHALYTKLRADTPLLASVFAWLEDHGTPPVAVRFRLRRGRSLAEADELLDKSLLDDGAPATGGRAPASPSFGDDSGERYAAAAAKALESGLRELLPADVFVLRPGAAPAGDAPSIDIDAEIAWSGLTYVGRSLHRRFVGIAVNVVATFHAKQGAAIGVRVETPDTFDVPADATNDARVYELMTAAALGRLATGLKNASFRSAGGADAPQGDEL